MLRRREAEKLMNEGMDDKIKGRYLEALDKFDKVIKGLAESDEERARLIIGEASHQLGVTLQNMGTNYKGALSYLWLAISYRQVIRDSIGLAYTYFQIPMCRLASKEKVEDVMPDFLIAERAMVMAISLAAREDDFKVLGDMWHNSAYICQIQKDYEAAADTYAKALVYRRKSEDERGRGLTLARMAECGLAIGRTFLARVDANEALKIFRKIGDVKRIVQVEKILEEIKGKENKV